MDEGALQALADGELSGEERHAAERHLDACSACRAELDVLRSASRELAGALSLLDHPAPQSRDFIVAVPRQRPVQRGWRTSRSFPRAAVLVLGFAAAASATIPGSPVRTWLSGLGEREPETVAVTESAPAAPAAATASRQAAMEEASFAAEAGISVLPSQGQVRIILRDASPDLQVRAVLVEQARAGVYASGGAASARFSTGPGRIEVKGAGPGELRIELPRAAYNATVVVNGKPYLTKQGEQMKLSVPAQDSAATEVLFKVQPH